MRSFFAFVLAAGLFASGAHAQIRTTLDVFSGVSLNQLGNQSQLTIGGQPIRGLVADYPLAAGFSGALRARIGTDRFAGRASVGVLTTGTVFDVTTPLLGRDDLSLAFVTGALEAEIGERFGPVHAYVVGGPELRIRLGEDSDGPLDLGDVDRYLTAVGVGVGARFRAGPLRLGPEVRGTLGLATFSDDRFEFGPLNIALDEGLTLDNLSLGFAIGADL